jgi:hypothetical protein
MGCSVSRDQDLRRLHDELRQQAEDLVKRLEAYEELVTARENEAVVADEVAGFVRFVERELRGWYERCRDLREKLEDPDLRSRPGTRHPDADPRGD